MDEFHSFYPDSGTNPRQKTTQSKNDADQIESDFQECGLSTQEALAKLHQDIRTEIDRVRSEFARRKLISWLMESVSFGSELSKMRWPSVLFMAAHVLAHLIVEFALDVDNLATNWVGFQGFILATLLIINLSINLWDTKLRSKELLLKSEHISELVERCSRDRVLLRKWRQHIWNPNQSRTPFAPSSPCVHKTLTYRDMSCLNLPDYLLVRGDIIHLFPGDRSPGHCVSFNDKNCSASSERVILKEGEIYRNGIEDDKPSFDHQNSGDICESTRKTTCIGFGHARLKKARPGSDFLMLSTPYIKSLRLSLQRSLKRPVNSVEKECFTISRKYFETLVIPSVFLLSTLVTAIHYGYLDFTDSDHKIKTISIAYLLMRPSLTIMPFLPWVFPCLWMLVNAYGSARLLCCSDIQRKKSKPLDGSGADQRLQPTSEISKLDNFIPTSKAPSSSAYRHDEDDLHDIRVDIPFTSIFFQSIDLVRGKGGHVWRSSSLLQVLGSLTSLCCIDKVGILSWPNPIPEKVFILSESNQIESHIVDRPSCLLDRDDDVEEAHGIQDQYKISTENSNIPNIPRITLEDEGLDCQTDNVTRKIHRPEILDISVVMNSDRQLRQGIKSNLPQSLQFDDLDWHKYINNLKPLGLAILLNNCCEGSFNDYYRFYKHISYESILRCKQTPVVKRRCLCELSKLIGFKKNSTNNQIFRHQVALYKVSDPKVTTKGKLASTLGSKTRLKFPFPNMTCNIHQDRITGSYQVFSQGTADIITDVCREFWDGKNLVPLDDSIRDKILDFYHRTSLTSYCTAMSYSSALDETRVCDYYIEISPESPRFDLAIRGLAHQTPKESSNDGPLVSIQSKLPVGDHKHDNSDQEVCDMTENDSLLTGTHLIKNKSSNHRLRRHLSSEELSRSKLDDTNQKRSHFLSKFLDELSDQVFVGMVSTQYQACPDFVSLVEQLEHACIRFIHFSNENELRSRVFSEKMGLESGWNCHISLQSEQDIDGYREQLNELQPEDLNDVGMRDNFRPIKIISSVLLGKHLTSHNDPKTDGSNMSISSKNTLYSWTSLPSVVMRLTAKLFTDRNINRKSNIKDADSSKTESPGDESDTKSLEVTSDSFDANVDDAGFESLVFDMSNRAKLPKGIENIRPHLETVDNVPLQVSLFTDCTPDLTKQMIEIMQDYGEIVCVLGSSASVLNTPVFLQANVSIGIKPLEPNFCLRRRTDRERNPLNEEPKLAKSSSGSKKQTPGTNKPRDRLGIACSHEPVQEESVKIIGRRRSSDSTSSSCSSSRSSCSSSSSSSSSSSLSKSEEQFSVESSRDIEGDSDESGNEDSLINEMPSPIDLACKLASLACSYNYSREEPFNLYSLILEARHFTFKMKNTFVCMICFALSISSAQFLASLLFLPPMFSSGLTIWLTIVVVPTLSFALMSTTMDSQVMKIAVGKNLQLKPENIRFFVICYLIKFIPSIIVVVLCFGLIIAHSCKLTGFGSSSLGPCWMFTYVQHSNTTSPDVSEDLLWSSHLLTAQVSAAFLTVLYFGKLHSVWSS